MSILSLISKASRHAGQVRARRPQRAQTLSGPRAFASAKLISMCLIAASSLVALVIWPADIAPQDAQAATPPKLRSLSEDARDSSTPGVSPTNANVAQDDWIDIPKPFHLFDLPAPLFVKQTSTYEARRRQTTDGREDTLTFGAFAGAAPWLRLSIYRAGPDDPVETGSKDIPFYLAIARTAARAGLAVGRSVQAATLDSRFGTLEIADVQLSAPYGASVPCQGFRVSSQKPALRMTGLACGTSQRPMDQAQLICALDRLDLVSAGEDRDLAAYFAAAEIKRGKACLKVATVAPEIQKAAKDVKIEPGKKASQKQGSDKPGSRRAQTQKGRPQKDTLGSARSPSGSAT